MGLLASARLLAAGTGWIRLETRHLTIFTQGNERKARDKAVEMERFIAGLDALFPQARPHRTPLTIVLFADAAQFAAYTPVVNNVAQPVGGYFTRLPHRGVIAMPLEGETVHVRRTIFHEGVHWYFSFLPAGRPPWFDEGLAEVLSTFEQRRREDLIGRAIDEHVLALTYFVRPPLAELFRTPREALNYNEAVRTGAFYALSWAFVHYAIFGQGGTGANSLATYLNELQKGTETKEAFGRAFGADYAGMEERVYTYLKSGKYGVIRTKFDPDSIDRTIRRGEADAAEMDLTLGFLNLVANRRPAAVERLNRALAARPDDPATREAWGMLELMRGNIDEARAHYRARGPQAGKASGLRDNPDRLQPDAFDRGALLAAAARFCRDIGDALQHVITRDKFAEGRVLAVEESGIAMDDEELRSGAVGVRRAGHRDHAADVGLGVELGLDLPAGTAGARHSRFAGLGVRAAALDHEALDDAVEGGAIVEPLPGQLLEVLDRLRSDVGPELDGHLAVAGLQHGDFLGGGLVGHGRKRQKVAPSDPPQEPK